MDIREEAIQDKSQDTELNGPNLSTTKECSSFETEQLKALAMMKDNLIMIMIKLLGQTELI